MQTSDNQSHMPPSNEASREETICGLCTELALHPTSDFTWGKGIENARALGYDPAWLEHLPADVWESSAAVGNPFGLGPIHPGETVVDLGCGAGADVCMAALLISGGPRYRRGCDARDGRKGAGKREAGGTYQCRNLRG